MSALPEVSVLHEKIPRELCCPHSLAAQHKFKEDGRSQGFVFPQCRSSEGGIQSLPCKDYSVELPFAFAWSLL